MNDDESAAGTAEGMGSEEPDEPGETTETETESESGSTGTEESSEPEEIGAEGGANDDPEERVDALETELAEREAEIGALESKLTRVQADFQNYKKRRERKEIQLRETATEDLVTRLLDVRDNLVRALEQDEGAEIREGIEATLREFDHVLENESVREVTPEPGSEVDPQRHEVMVRVESDQPEGAIDEVYTSGYEMGERLLRPAQVTVSEGSEGDEQ